MPDSDQEILAALLLRFLYANDSESKKPAAWCNSRASTGIIVGSSGQGCGESTYEVTYVLWTIFVILLVLWLLGLVSSYTLGGFIHILLVVAVVVLVIQLITGRRPAV